MEEDEAMGERWRRDERAWDAEDEVVVGRKESVVGAEAEAIAACLRNASESM